MLPARLVTPPHVFANFAVALYQCVAHLGQFFDHLSTDFGNVRALGQRQVAAQQQALGDLVELGHLHDRHSLLARKAALGGLAIAESADARA